MSRKYDSTVARIAGNIASGLVARGTYDGDFDTLVNHAVQLARLTVAETIRTEPPPKLCSRCSGTGTLGGYSCPECGGGPR